jgi:hypothetical protein
MLIYLTVAVVVLVVAAVILLRARRKSSAATDMDIPDMQTVQKVQHLAYRPGIKPVLPVPQKSIPRPVQKPGVLPRPGSTSVTEGIPDITTSLRTLTEKYSLDQFTIATADGLVFASSGGEDAQDDAARFGGMFVHDPPAPTPGVLLFSVDHKGSGLVGIIRTNLQVPGEFLQMIEKDTKDILNRWI